MRFLLVASVIILTGTMYEAYLWYTTNFATKTIPRMERHLTSEGEFDPGLVTLTNSGAVAQWLFA